MSVTWSLDERYRDLSGGQNSRSIGFVLQCTVTAPDTTQSDNDALDYLEANTDLTYDGMERESIEIEEVDYNEGFYFAKVNYSRERKKLLSTAETEYNFDISTTNQHIIQSFDTVGEYTLSGTAEELNGMIAVDADNVPQGVDVIVPVSTFNVRIVLANATVTSAYQKIVRELVGKTNNATFYSHAAGEVLFVGCTGTKRSGTDWELNYRFQTSPNRTGLTVGGITGIAVKGWEVLWVRYRPDKSNRNRFIQKPVQVNVEKVYESGDFSTLGIGT